MMLMIFLLIGILIGLIIIRNKQMKQCTYNECKKKAIYHVKDFYLSVSSDLCNRHLNRLFNKFETDRFNWERRKK